MQKKNQQPSYLYLTIFLLFGFTISFCKAQNNSYNNEAGSIKDTIIGSKIITTELAGSAYRDRGKLYFLIIDKDTSAFTCFFEKLKENRKVRMNIHFEENTKTYRQRIKELQKILPEAARDFVLDSLKYIGLGRLILNGDLAIDITKQYVHKFGMNKKIIDYKKFTQFLLTSKLADDFNEILRPYNLLIDKIYAEKIFFTTLVNNRIEINRANTPAKILDCIISLSLKKLN